MVRDCCNSYFAITEKRTPWDDDTPRRVEESEQDPEGLEQCYVCENYFMFAELAEGPEGFSYP